MGFSSDDSLVGKRVRIRAIKREGSARRLDGITAVVTGLHPLTPGWYTITLDENPITHLRDWTIPADRLVVLENG
jgi:hypothetical protein